MCNLSNFITSVNNIIWQPIYFLLFCLGLYFCFKTNFFHVRKFGFILKKTFGLGMDNKSKKNIKGEFTPLQALSTSLASTVGAGNIVGVAVSIVNGGPGSIFWIWIVAILGMVIKYSEIVLALKFREKNKNGEWCGGPMYYIENGLKNKIWAYVFAIFMILYVVCGVNIVQSNSIAGIIYEYVGLKKIFSGFIFAIIIFLVIFNGMQSIGKVTEKLVPFMCVLYFFGSLFILIMNYKLIPGALINIFSEAFKTKSIYGGAIYGIFLALRYGIARGIHSSEAGMGTSPIAQASSNLKNPVEQGLYGIIEVFVSLFIICTSTALVILTSGIYDKNIYLLNLGADKITKNNLPTGIVLVAKSFAKKLGEDKTDLFIMISIILFALSTIIGSFYYGLRSYEFIFKNKFVWVYKLFFLVMIILGATINAKIAWELNDLTVGLMTLINLISIFLLKKLVVDETKIYFDGDKKI